MRFAHLADCHIGGWREPELRSLSIESFRRAGDTCISRRVDFVLISGDLFDSAMPAIEMIKDVVEVLKKIRDNGIEIYIVAGSHDFSASGKTMIDVLEKVFTTTHFPPKRTFSKNEYFLLAINFR